MFKGLSAFRRGGAVLLSAGVILSGGCQPVAPEEATPEWTVTGEGLGAAEAQARLVEEGASLRCEALELIPQRVDYTQPGPYGVATLDMTFEREVAEGSPRSLVTTIYYPAAAGPTFPLQRPRLAEGGPFPLIMYSHGFGSSRAEAGPIAKLAASYGYVTVAPDFPNTNTGKILAGEADTNDAANQPADVSFLIDQTLALSSDPRHVLFHAVDPERIAATGVSLGGFTTYLLAFHPELHDPRIKAAAPIAGLSSFFMEGYYHTRDLPLLIVHGDQDAFVNYENNARRAFERAAPNAHLVTLHGGSHAAFAMQLDAATLGLMNGLLAPPGTDPSNPDGYGCGAVGGSLESDGNVAEALGGADSFIEGDAMPPCVGDEYKYPAMDATEQVNLGAQAVVAFFEAHLADAAATRQEGCRHLVYELHNHPAVTVE